MRYAAAPLAFGVCQKFWPERTQNAHTMQKQEASNKQAYHNLVFTLALGHAHPRPSLAQVGHHVRSAQNGATAPGRARAVFFL